MKDILLYENVPLLENNFTVKFMEFSDSHYLNPHWHEHIELTYFLSGECDFTCNGQTFVTKANDFVIANSTEIHSFTSRDGVSYFSILLYPEFFRDVNFSEKNMLKNLIHNDTFIRDTIRNMYLEHSKSEKWSDMILKGTAYHLMAYLMQNYTSTFVSDKELSFNAVRLSRINTILDYISCHYQKKITTSDLAELCFISEGHLCRFFRTNIGKSATEYINEFRIEKAAIMLTNTNDSVTDIAWKVGFEDINYFSRVFRKIKHESPIEYRKKTIAYNEK